MAGSSSLERRKQPAARWRSCPSSRRRGRRPRPSHRRGFPRRGAAGDRVARPAGLRRAAAQGPRAGAGAGGTARDPADPPSRDLLRVEPDGLDRSSSSACSPRAARRWAGVRLRPQRGRPRARRSRCGAAARRLRLRALRAGRDRPPRGAAAGGARCAVRGRPRPRPLTRVIGELEALIHEHPFRERSAAAISCSPLPLRSPGRCALTPTGARAGRWSRSSGIEPGPRLRSLQRAILDQDPALEPVRATARTEAAEPALETRKLVTVLIADSVAPTGSTWNAAVSATIATLGSRRARSRATAAPSRACSEASSSPCSACRASTRTTASAPALLGPPSSCATASRPCGSASSSGRGGYRGSERSGPLGVR